MNIARSVRHFRRLYAPGTITYPARVEIDGARWALHGHGNLSEYLMWLHHAYPEPQSVAALSDIVRGRSAQILDVGANCGIYSVALAKAAAAGSRVVSFEPNPQMRERLCANLDLNDIRAEIEDCALGSGPGTAVLHLHGNMGQSSLAPRRGEGPVIEVSVRPLADFVQPGWQMTILKIDVEGFEAEVLLPFFDAAPEPLWPTHVLIEVEHAETWSGDVFGKLRDCGYREMFRAEGNALYARGPAQV